MVSWVESRCTPASLVPRIRSAKNIMATAAKSIGSQQWHLTRTGRPLAVYVSCSLLRELEEFVYEPGRLPRYDADNPIREQVLFDENAQTKISESGIPADVNLDRHFVVIVQVFDIDKISFVRVPRDPIEMWGSLRMRDEAMVFCSNPLTVELLR